MRDAELFARIEYLMQTEGVYRQNDLTIERLAERLDTNRTYISRAINQQAGKAFSSYVNSYRIDEAVRRLSDVDDDTPLKALAQMLGYNHLQTFYTSFQSAIGMPSSKYRENCSNSTASTSSERNPVFRGLFFRNLSIFTNSEKKLRFINRPASSIFANRLVRRFARCGRCVSFGDFVRRMPV